MGSGLTEAQSRETPKGVGVGVGLRKKRAERRWRSRSYRVMAAGAEEGTVVSIGAGLAGWLVCSGEAKASMDGFVSSSPGFF